MTHHDFGINWYCPLGAGEGFAAVQRVLTVRHRNRRWGVDPRHGDLVGPNLGVDRHISFVIKRELSGRRVLCLGDTGKRVDETTDIEHGVNRCTELTAGGVTHVDAARPGYRSWIRGPSSATVDLVLALTQDRDIRGRIDAGYRDGV